MAPLISAAKIFSTLGNSSSLVPIGVKDVSNSLGITAGSYIAGDKVEGKDRFIDEFGTQAIWLGGIPAYKALIDVTLYKAAKYNSKIDIRVLKDPEILKRAIHYAPENLKAGFEKVKANPKMFKGLFMTKFIAATALTMASYGALTNFRHKHTEKVLIKEIIKEEKAKNPSFNALGNTPNVKAKNLLVKNSTPSFGMNFSKGLSDFMFNPVKNLMIVDGGITTERLTNARNPQDFMGYVLKEGFFWGFMYFAGDAIQHHLEKSAKAKHNKSIDLDIRVLQNEEFKNSLKSGDIKTHLEDFTKNKTDVEIYNYLNENPKNLVVKMAKESGIISTFKKSGAVDTQKFIDINEVKGVHSKMEKLYAEFTDAAAKKGETLETFLKQATRLKRFSIMKNIGACVTVLGVVMPGIMIAMRLANKDNKEFQVKKDLKEKLMATNFKGVA